MKKYKICPSCHTKNAPSLIECISCEADLTRVRITDEENERLAEEKEASEVPASELPQLSRVCDCGEKNPPNARKCKACGEDISDVAPTAHAQVSEADGDKRLHILSSLDGKYAYKVTADEVTVGRECTMNEYLSEKSYVSRIHARLTVREGELYIENLSGTNFTFVNNKKITSVTRLQCGDEIGLGGKSINGKRQDSAAYFLVREEQCT